MAAKFRHVCYIFVSCMFRFGYNHLFLFTSVTVLTLRIHFLSLLLKEVKKEKKRVTQI